MKIKKKIILVLIDGMGDRGEATPLEKAKTPAMDFLAKNGKTGLMYSVDKGIAPESDVAVMSILGYDPAKYYCGRGPIEALGVGIKTRLGELTLRGNFATVDNNWNIIDIRAGRIGDREAKELIAELEEIELTDADFMIKHLGGYRFVLKIKGPFHLSPKITNTHPGYVLAGEIPIALPKSKWKIKKSEALSNSRGAITAAKLVNEFTEKSYKILKNHPLNKKRKLPANIVVLRDAGNKLPVLPTYEQKYGQIWISITEKPVERGLSILAGMDTKEYELGVYDGVADMVNKSLEYYDGVYLHIKGPDNFGHDGDFVGKKNILEKIDKKIISKLDRDAVICITADHSTPCDLKAHSSDPVPVLIYGGKSDNVKKFGENFCNKGSLGFIKGIQLMDLVEETACTLQ